MIITLIFTPLNISQKSSAAHLTGTYLLNTLNIKFFNSCIDRPNQKAHNKLELKPYSANESNEDPYSTVPVSADKERKRSTGHKL